MSETTRNMLAAAIALAAIAIAVVFWPRGPIDLGDDWLQETACVPSVDGVRFTGSLQMPSGESSSDPLDGISHIVVEVAAHEGGRQVATSSSVHDVSRPTTGTAELVAVATTADHLAAVDMLLPVGAVKSPTCVATVTGHR